MIRIFVINLQRDKRKLRHMEMLFASNGIRFERMDAVDGKRLDEATINQYVSQNRAMAVMGRPLAMGEVGCALSHIAVYEKMLREGDEQVVILEDDIEFDPSFKACLKTIDYLPADWEVVLLGHRSIESGFVEAPASFWRRKYLGDGLRCIRFAEFPFGTHGYLINRKGAEKLLKATRPLTEPIDHYTGDDTLVNLYGISPVCIRLEPVLEKQSNISQERYPLNEMLMKPDGKVKRMLKHFPFVVPMLKGMLRVFHRSKYPHRYCESRGSH